LQSLGVLAFLDLPPRVVEKVLPKSLEIQCLELEDLLGSATGKETLPPVQNGLLLKRAKAKPTQIG